jgi:LmbE family N-acetylglucosaminyl deacetylase
MNSNGNWETPASSGWMGLCDPETGLSSSQPKVNARVLLLAAHPDDETIGASTVLTRLPDATVVFLTDGAPHDPKLWSPDAKGSRADYARMRWEEAISALALAGISRERILSLGAVDQDAIFAVPALVAWFAALLCQLQPEILLTHPYEGGHPDHDAAALIAQLATRNLKCDSETTTIPQLIEMTSYHAREGSCESGNFLPYETQSAAELVIPLSPEDRTRKETMLARYTSQRYLLQNFDSDRERFRLAPRYDFRRPPHPGKLWYECLGWPTTGARWRELAIEAVDEFQDEVCV